MWITTNRNHGRMKALATEIAAEAESVRRFLDTLSEGTPPTPTSLDLWRMKAGDLCRAARELSERLNLEE